MREAWICIDYGSNSTPYLEIEPRVNLPNRYHCHAAALRNKQVFCACFPTVRGYLSELVNS